MDIEGGSTSMREWGREREREREGMNVLMFVPRVRTARWMDTDTRTPVPGPSFLRFPGRCWAGAPGSALC